MSETQTARRLTHLVRGAGCASKIGPATLTSVLRGMPIPTDDRLIVGLTTGDDAGVYRISSDQAIVQTVDFFTPVVDDAFTYGQIAAANALSDVYAMGGTPLTAMNIVCYPVDTGSMEELGAILRGGSSKVAEAGAALVGGHSVDDPEPKFGLSVTGVIDPDHVATNAGAQPGDAIVLTKRLGTGIVTTAAKFDECPPEVFEAAVESMATLNAAACRAMRAIGIGAGSGVHAATDITGFSLLGHLYHLARSSEVRIRLSANAVPAFTGVEQLAEAGNTTRGGKANADYLASAVVFAEEVTPQRRSLLFDPQTSGGLAICVSQDRLSDLLGALAAERTSVWAHIGSVEAGAPGIDVTA